MSASERGGKEKGVVTMVASDQTDLSSCFLFHIMSICFGGYVVESAWLWDLTPCHAGTQTSQIGVLRLRKTKSLWTNPHTDVLVYRSLNSSKCF